MLLGYTTVLVWTFVSRCGPHLLQYSGNAWLRFSTAKIPRTIRGAPEHLKAVMWLQSRCYRACITVASSFLPRQGLSLLTSQSKWEALLLCPLMAPVCLTGVLGPGSSSTPRWKPTSYKGVQPHPEQETVLDLTVHCSYIFVEFCFIDLDIFIF